MRIILGLFAPVVFAGCASTPMPVVDNPSDYDSRTMPWGDINKVADAEVKFRSYYLLYSEEATRKRMYAQKDNEVGFYASTIGILGGIAKSVPVAAAGGLVGAGTGVYNDRYKLISQTHNYELASQAMRCMYFTTQEVSAIPEGKYFIQLGVGTPTPVEKELKRIAVKNLMSVRDKLINLQATFELGKPDLTKLKEAANNAANADPGQVKIGLKGTGDRANLMDYQTLGDTDDVGQKVSTYGAEMDKCAALIAG